jgi:hypothetical protein
MEDGGERWNEYALKTPQQVRRVNIVSAGLRE